MTTSGTLRKSAGYVGATGVSTAFGTFGELLQGRLPERDGDFLVTLPVARWAVATFSGDPRLTELRVEPGHKLKALRLTEMIMEWAPVPMGGVLTIDSGIPEGKGLASSSADLVATARAVANALGVEMPPRLIEAFLSRIEPTDGVLYPGIVAYYHRRVQLREVLGPLPSMTVVGVDEGGEIDTVEFNRIPKPFSAADRRQYARLLEEMRTAVHARDLPSVGAVATRSAVMNQALRPKRLLEAVMGVCEQVGGLGVVAAHSGTMLGVLLDTADARYPEKVAAAASACSTAAGNVAVYRSLSFDNNP
ncbi:hypothetical protein [Streptosporangium carneum]|uniref:Kinase n=1 Tax=Streptosporangium carneum TaxID=47481 RepID=A0A9W6I7D9_9ACTN|nr:hypothetical protein [Streptosporangium carneum]GLK12335.1 kinase [Streptosporangium carneum]